jgi:hypothetical protein
MITQARSAVDPRSRLSLATGPSAGTVPAGQRSMTWDTRTCTRLDVTPSAIASANAPTMAADAANTKRRGERREEILRMLASS